MKQPYFKTILAVTSIVVASSANAATVEKAASGAELTDEASWIDNGADLLPDSDDIAAWTATSLTGEQTVGTATIWNRMQFTSLSGELSLSGSDITLSAVGNTTAILGNGSQAITIGNNINLTNANTGSLTVGSTSNRITFSNNGSGVLTLDGDITLNQNTTANNANFMLRGDGRIVVNGTLNIEGQFYKGDPNTVTLNSANTIGWVYANNGTLLAGHNEAFGAGTIYFGGGGGTPVIASKDSTARSFGNALEFSQNATFGQTTGGTGTLTFSGAVNLGTAQRTITTHVDTTFSNTVSGSGGFAKGGAGTLLLNGDNNYTGITSFTAGTLAVGSNTALGSGELRFGGGTLVSSDSTARTFDHTLDVAASSTLGSATTGKLTFTGTRASVFGSGAKALTVNGVAEFSGVLTDSGGTNAITKAGEGTLIFSNANTYSRTGGTIVNAGTFLVTNTTGSGTGTGKVDVNGGVLGGTGFITGDVTINAAILRGGMGDVASAALTLGNVTLGAGSVIELALGAGGTHSSLNFTGTESFQADQTFNFVDLGATTGTYASIITDVSSVDTSNWVITNEGWTGQFVWNSETNAIDLNLTNVPEPSAALLGGLGVLALLRRRRA